MDISIDLVVEAARRRLAALTPEVVGYVVLLAAQRLAPRPSRVSPVSVFLTESGDVHVRPEPTASELEVEAALRGLLAILLELSPSPAPAITAVAEARPNGSLQAFTAELSAALIPINHAAAHRALARLYRETVRAQGLVVDTTAPPPLAPMPSLDADGELDIDVGLEPELAARCVLREQRSDVRELLELYLSDTRSDDRMTRTLRTLVRLEACSPLLTGEAKSREASTSARAIA
jgi:hypothetical protein